MATVAWVVAIAFASGAGVITLGNLAGRLPRDLWEVWALEAAVVAWILLPALAGRTPWVIGVAVTAVVVAWELTRSVGLRWWTALFPGLGLVALGSMAPLQAVVLFGCVELCDTGAFLFGKLGRQPLAPQISPNKTVEGALAGVACAGLAGWLAGPALGVHPATGLVLGTLAVLADLATSSLKRHVGIKDFGAWLPRHGSMLDVYDSLLLLAPLWALYLRWP